MSAGGGFPSPRPFQVTAHEAIRQAVREGHRKIMVMAPTGSGKTYLGLRICHETMKKGNPAVFMCDRTTLINQTSARASEYGMDHGIVQADHWRFRPYEPFQICSAQTIARRDWPAAKVEVIDEAHTQLKVWTEHIGSSDAVTIGLSATPFSKGLGKLFTKLINATTMHELTQQKILVPLVPYSCTAADMTGAETAGGEWTDRAAAERGTAIIGDVVSEWIKFGENRKTIVFGATIKHCEEMARAFSGVGVMAALFTSETKEDERKSLLKEYEKPDSNLRVLISVEALAKGFDVPDVGCIVDCRPLRKSLSTAIQMWGRGLRSSPETGKKDCILLDHSGNFIRFLADFQEIYFNGLEALDSGEKLDKEVRKEPEEDYQVKTCPACGFKPFLKRCISCGFQKQAAPSIETLPGHMRPVIIGQKKLAENHRDLWEQVAHYAKTMSAPEKQQGRAWNLFRDLTGQPPPAHWRVRDVKDDIFITQAVINQIRRKNIAWKKSQQKGAA